MMLMLAQSNPQLLALIGTRASLARELERVEQQSRLEQLSEAELHGKNRSRWAAWLHNYRCPCPPFPHPNPSAGRATRLTPSGLQGPAGEGPGGQQRRGHLAGRAHTCHARQQPQVRAEELHCTGRH